MIIWTGAIVREESSVTMCPLNGFGGGSVGKSIAGPAWVVGETVSVAGWKLAVVVEP